MTIYLMNADADTLPEHPVLSRPEVVPFYILSFFAEGDDFEARCREAVKFSAVRLFWTNEDLLSVGKPGQATPEEFAATLAKGTGVSVRDRDRYATYARVCREVGAWPKVIQIGSEHSGQSLAPSIKQYDTLRCRIAKDALVAHGFYPNATDIAIDWMNLTSQKSVYADDYNCSPLTFLAPRDKGRSNAQHYSINFAHDAARSVIPWPGWLGRLQSYLSQCSPGAMPFLDAVGGPDKIAIALDLCTKYKASPIFFLSASYGGSVDWQMGQVEYVLANRGG